MKLRSVTIFQE